MSHVRSINEWCQKIHTLARSKGWYDKDVPERTSLELHMLVACELAEATEEVRKGRPPIYQVQKNYHEKEIAGGIVIVSLQDRDFIEAQNWYVSNTGHVKSTTNSHLLHRLILQPKDDELVDHINCNPLDNRRVNLRIVTKKENQRNQGPSKGKKYKGVTWNGINQKFIAQITVDYKNYYLGSFNTEAEAALAYDQAAKTHFGKHAWLNSEIKETKDTDIILVTPDDPRWQPHLKPEGEAVELADAAIRLLDIFAFKGWNLEEVLSMKHDFNMTRPHRHGGKLK